METVEITIKVDANIAAIFKRATPERQKEISNLIGCLLKEPTDEEKAKAIEALEQTANQAGQEAKAKGLTPEILEEIINEK